MRRVKCGQTIGATSIASRLLPRLLSLCQSRPGCWPTSKRGNSTYPFVKALVAANNSGNVPGKKTDTDTETPPYSFPLPNQSPARTMFSVLVLLCKHENSCFAYEFVGLCIMCISLVPRLSVQVKGGSGEYSTKFLNTSEFRR